MLEIIPRHANPTATEQLVTAGYSSALAKIYSARGITRNTQLEHSLANLLPLNQLKNAGAMAVLLADAIASGKKLLVIADYDADGATACAVAVRGLRMFGAQVDFIVPNRFEYGYGLTPEIVRLAAKENPDIIITVDNGIASVEGVAEANRLGIQVLVTDHHLPGDVLPEAACIVNPNQPGCSFPSKNLAGVGVIFYVLLALRAELRTRNNWNNWGWNNWGQTRFISPAATPQNKSSLTSIEREPNLANLLDLVALGTVADVVKLDQNNRILVQQGLLRIRAGKACAGINALFQIAKKNPARAISQDLGFAIGPRLNAAGRLEDMRLGIDCLLSDDDDAAMLMAKRLDELNHERRSIETDMQEAAMAALETIQVVDNYSLALFNSSWHQGVIGILASRLKDKFHRPVIAFALSTDKQELKGSGRSIGALHLRDALDLVSKRHPTLIKKFGGHAAAAGLTIAHTDYGNFVEAFEQVIRELLSEADLQQKLESDGALTAQDINLEFAQQLDQQIWGQGFPAPVFDDDFVVQQQRVVGEKHLRLRLSKSGQLYEAILFGYAEPLPDSIHAAYSLSVNEYNGKRSVQLIIRHWQ
ncbi:MAG: single-stranded-DNA-specific exonuclease RecJ [Gallionella sp.]|nr:single-stranded-DNA-specific exonuclease RecJ [Gallionella sp.]